MTGKTATESILDDDRSTDERQLHDAMQRFANRWAPADRREAADFHADLLMVMQALHRDTMRPVNALLRNSLSLMPPIIPKVEK